MSRILRPVSWLYSFTVISHDRHRRCKICRDGNHNGCYGYCSERTVELCSLPYAAASGILWTTPELIAIFPACAKNHGRTAPRAGRCSRIHAHRPLILANMNDMAGSLGVCDCRCPFLDSGHNLGNLFVFDDGSLVPLDISDKITDMDHVCRHFRLEIAVAYKDNERFEILLRNACQVVQGFGVFVVLSKRILKSFLPTKDDLSPL